MCCPDASWTRTAEGRPPDRSTLQEPGQAAEVQMTGQFFLVAVSETKRGMRMQKVLSATRPN